MPSPALLPPSIDGGRRPRVRSRSHQSLRRRHAYAPYLLAAAVVLASGGIGVAQAEAARVQRVLDGDSLRLHDGREVRLIGINAPEFGKNGRPDEPLAAAAHDHARALAQGQTVRLVYDRERFDHYGRLLAYVVLGDGRELQEMLLRDGLAWFVAIPPNLARLAVYRTAEAQARGARRGVWAVEAYQPVAAARLAPSDTGFKRIVGTVDRVTHVDGAAMLRLADGVHLLLPHPNPDIPAPQALVGRRVLARGWLTEYKNELRMRITHPAMLELLP